MSDLLEQASAARPSYAPVGATLSADGVPPGFDVLRVRRTIGQGADRFENAKEAIRDWAGHRRAGAILQPERQDLTVGNDVALALRIWPLWVTATCRVVAVVDEPHRFGFAYGTLPHHPASGEEAFTVRRDPTTDEVELEIFALSRPASRLAKLGGPVSRAFQRFTAGRYLDGFERPSTATDQSTATGRPVTSLRWWFENRDTGGFTIAQFPNWPLFAIAGATVVRRLAEAGTATADGAGWTISALWLYWGGDELLRGVNPWRRLLGISVIGWQSVRLLAS